MKTNKKAFKGIRVFRSSMVDTFQIWGKATRRSEEEAVVGCFGPNYIERNPVFNRPGFYVDRVGKSCWYEMETRPGGNSSFRGRFRATQMGMGA